jgi:uncharacterized integral membrane protein
MIFIDMNNPLKQNISCGVRSRMDRLKKIIRENKSFLLAAIAILALIVLSDDSMCLFRLTTGLPCPTCGMTRATFALFKLDFKEAFFFHPMVFVVIPFLICLTVLLLLKKTTIKKCTPYMIALGVCIFIVYIIRMILFFPHTFPMDFEENSIAGFLIRLLG